MHKKIFISEIKEGQTVESVFLVKLKSLQQTKANKPYVNVILMDKTGELEARIRENALALSEKFDKDTFIYVKAKSSRYNDRIQLSISDVQRISEDLVSLPDFQPASGMDISRMQKELKDILHSLENKHLKRLLQRVFSDESLLSRFSTAPAAKGVHHAFLGGLLEHTLNLAKVARALTPYYPMVNMDLVVSGLLLHDIGKIRELIFNRSFEYSTEGRLLGHITIGANFIENTIRELPDFPESLRIELLHIILSHHGELEFGSPKRPKTLEAIMVSQLDDMDSKLYGVFQFASEDKNQLGNGWTQYHKTYERFFYLPKLNPHQSDPEAEKPVTHSFGNQLASALKEKLQPGDKKATAEEKNEKKEDSEDPKLFEF